MGRETCPSLDTDQLGKLGRTRRNGVSGCHWMALLFEVRRALAALWCETLWTYDPMVMPVLRQDATRVIVILWVI